MATNPFAPPVPSPSFSSNYGPVTPQPPVLLATPQQLTANAANFTSVFIQPVNALWIYLNINGFAVSDIVSLRFNNDSANNYWSRHLTAVAGGVVFVDNPTVSTALIRCSLTGTTQVQVFATIGNPSATAALSKLVSMRVAQATGAAGTAGTAYAFSGGEWANTANPINRIDVLTAGGNNMLAGSSLEVWGCF